MSSKEDRQVLLRAFTGPTGEAALAILEKMYQSGPLCVGTAEETTRRAAMFDVVDEIKTIVEAAAHE